MDNDSHELKLLIKELETQILKKLETIKTRVLTKSSGDAAQDLQVLAMACDELDDVLLNWDFPTLGSVPVAPEPNFLDEDFEDED